MPISYSMNSCASTWYPADDPRFPHIPPLRPSELARPAETIMIAESQWAAADFYPWFLWQACPAVFAHPAGKVGNFIFYDGHVKSKKWLSTLYPLTENNWQPGPPNPDPNNLRLAGATTCAAPGPTASGIVPPGPTAKEFRTQECLTYQ